MKNRFTLVELLIVMAILAVLASVATLSYSKYVEDAYESKKNQYVQMVEAAKDEAVLNGSFEDGDPITFDQIKYYLINIDEVSDLTVSGDAINIGNIGEKACYGGDDE